MVFGETLHLLHKKEVVVNAVTGTAALVSPGRPGSVHDLTVMRGNAEVINRLVGDAIILGDKGYRGGRSSVPSLFVVEDGDIHGFRDTRVLVECFFGRLKKKYGVFGTKWTLSADVFDIYFDCACAMTNVDILFHPLEARDEVFNRGVIAQWQVREARRREERAEANRVYRRRMGLERLAQAEAVSRDIRVMTSLLFPEDGQS